MADDSLKVNEKKKKQKDVEEAPQDFEPRAGLFEE